jgi:putative transferase (TIGR04331 family)
MVPNDMSDFIRLMIGDPWNHFIFTYLIQKYTSIPIRYKDLDSRLPQPICQKKSMKSRIKQISFFSINKIFSILANNSDIFIISPYFSSTRLLILYLKLYQFPALRLNPSSSSTKWFRRAFKFKIQDENSDEFVRALREIIPQQIPLAYVEGFTELVKCAERLGWPTKPKVIFTSNSHFYNDLFKLWAAIKVSKGSKLLIGTHGSGPDYLFSSPTLHEWKISSFHLGPIESTKYAYKSIVSTHNFRPFKKHDKTGRVLLVELNIPRYSYSLASAPISSDYLLYLEDQYRFYDSLPSEIKEQVSVRKPPHEDYWEINERWINRYPSIKIDNISSFHKSVSKSRVVISSYFGTNYSDLISSNIPTIVFWNPLLFQASILSADLFREMEEVGIFHTTPESAATHLISIWSDIDSWWFSAQVQNVREKFSLRYAYQPENYLTIVSTAIKRLMI